MIWDFHYFWRSISGKILSKLRRPLTIFQNWWWRIKKMFFSCVEQLWLEFLTNDKCCDFLKNSNFKPNFLVAQWSSMWLALEFPGCLHNNAKMKKDLKHFLKSALPNQCLNLLKMIVCTFENHNKFGYRIIFGMFFFLQISKIEKSKLKSSWDLMWK